MAGAWAECAEDLGARKSGGEAHREELLRVRVRQLRLDLVHHRLRVLAVHPERRRRAGASRIGESEIDGGTIVTWIGSSDTL